MEQAGKRKRKTETKGERESLFVTVQVPVTERKEKEREREKEGQRKEEREIERKEGITLHCCTYLSRSFGIACQLDVGEYLGAVTGLGV